MTRITWYALAVVAVAVGIRVYDAASTYVNPDEAMHFIAANTPSTWETYRNSLTTAHPPLFLLVLHWIMQLGSTELMMRLPNLVAGSVALWLAFRWLQRAMGDAIALAGLIFLAGAPAMIAVSNEVRQYGLLLLGVCGALYCMERVAAQRSAAWVGAFAVSLYVAIVSHYTAAGVVLTLGIYVPWRLWQERVPVSVGVAWVVSQCGAAALYTWLYATHLRGLRGGGMEAAAVSGWLQHAYYRPGYHSVAQFCWNAFDGAFRYLVGAASLGVLTVALFLVGVVLISVGKAGDRGARRDYAVLLTLPLLFGCAAAVWGLLPFGATRHVGVILPFVAAGVAVSVASAVRHRPTLVLLVGCVVLPAWLWWTAPPNDPRQMARGEMQAALDYLTTAVPEGSVVMVDGQTHLVLLYYLDREAKGPRVTRHGPINETALVGRRLFSFQDSWGFSADQVESQTRALAERLALPAGEPVWIMSIGWDHPPFDSLLTPTAAPIRKHFGDITLVQTAVGYL